jgi:membrane protein YdbS with pleckstrin-like domain
MEHPHPRVRWVWIIRALVVGGVLFFIGLAAQRFGLPIPTTLALGVGIALGVLGTGHAISYYRSWAFEIQDDALYLIRGVVTEVETAVPYVRVQHVDTKRGPVARLVGLSSVVVYTAGTRGADIEIPGLQPARARALRDTLRDLAIESEGNDAV